MKSPPNIAGFDSATAMLRALANFLHGQDFPLLGTQPRWLEPARRWVGATVNKLPRALREQVYIWSGWAEAISPQKLPSMSAERVAEWMVSLYPRRQYPAIAMGSANGAATHLWAALGIPWLPQTFLMPVARSGIPPDEPAADRRWAQEPARVFLEHNPDVQLHHMHDPNQDRLMIQRMTYFRLKRRRLGPAYERFLRETLAPGGTILLVECGLKWPTTRSGERHVFQFGALGGATAAEYHHGGERVRDYLARYQAGHERWQPPQPDSESPEAEWGFEPSLRHDVERLAQQQGWPLRRMQFEQPEDVSPLVADFYRWWNHRRDLSESRLLVESFILMEPRWTITTGSAPFWMVFNTEPSAHALRDYLDHTPPFNEILMMLFSHGVNSIGLVPIEQWRTLLARAQKHNALVGVDPSAYPRDFAVFTRYHQALWREPVAHYPLPSPEPLRTLDDFLAAHGQAYPVQWR